MKAIMRTLGLRGQAGARAGRGRVSWSPDAEVTGVTMTGDGDGGWRLELEKLLLRNLRLQGPEISVDIAQISLKDVQLRLGPAASGEGWEPKGLKAGEIELQGVRLELSGAFSCAAPAGGTWRLDALGGMEGRLHAFITDAAWIIDADVSLTVEQGQLDFNRVSVQHIGPNSSMGVSPAGIYIDAVRGGRRYLYLFTDGKVPGASFEQREARSRRVSDRGQLDLQAFVQGVLGSGNPAGFGKAADRHVESKMDRTRLNGEFRLGDGVLGMGAQEVVLDGQAQGRNRVQFSAAMLAHKLQLRMPELQASRAGFEILGLKGRTGAISASAMLEASDLRGKSSPQACGPAIRLEVDQASMREVAWGDLAGGQTDGPEVPQAKAGGGDPHQRSP